MPSKIPQLSFLIQGQYWVFYNYVPAAKKFKCNETVTYTTHCDHTFLDNLVPLLKRWQGPISVALYTPGSDYDDAMKAVSYYRYRGIRKIKTL